MLTDPRPTAIICANNFLTLGCIRYLSSIGIEVPGDVSVVSYDDLEHLAMIYPFLTVVTQPTQQIGRIAAKILIERQMVDDQGAPGSPSRVEIKPELIVRRSSGPPPVTASRG